LTLNSDISNEEFIITLDYLHKVHGIRDQYNSFYLTILNEISITDERFFSMIDTDTFKDLFVITLTFENILQELDACFFQDDLLNKITEKILLYAETKCKYLCSYFENKVKNEIQPAFTKKKEELIKFICDKFKLDRVEGCKLMQEMIDCNYNKINIHQYEMCKISLFSIFNSLDVIAEYIGVENLYHQLRYFVSKTKTNPIAKEYDYFYKNIAEAMKFLDSFFEELNLNDICILYYPKIMTKEGNKKIVFKRCD
ncbi:hypothetical protein H312_03466, partial [Anncaliia algerae PRA339]